MRISRRSIGGRSWNGRGEAISSSSTFAPQEEFQASHLPFAPLDAARGTAQAAEGAAQGQAGGGLLPRSLLPDGRRGVDLLRRRGYRARRLEDGVAEWRFHGLRWQRKEMGDEDPGRAQ